MLFAVAEGKLNVEEGEEAMKAATEALEIFRELGDSNGESDVFRIMFNAYRLKADSEDVKPTEAKNFVKDKLAQFKESGNTRGQAVMLMSLAELKYDSGGLKKREEALEHALQAREIFADVGDATMEAMSLLVVGNCHLRVATRRNERLDRVKEWEAALEANSKAMEIYQRLGDRKGVGKALHGSSIPHGHLEHNDEAIKCAKDSRRIWRELGIKKQEAFELWCIAGLYSKMNQPQNAASVAKEAVDLFWEIGYGKNWQAHSLASLVNAHIESDDFATAQVQAEVGLQHFQEKKDKKAEAYSKQLLVNTHLANFEKEKALKAAQESLALFRDLKEKKLEPSLLNCIGGVQLQSKEYSKAVQFSEQAAKLSRDLGKKREEANALQTLVYANLAQDETADAMKAAKQAVAIFKKTGEKSAEYMANLLVATVQVQMGETRDALFKCRKAATYWQRSEEKDCEAVACHMAADICAGKNDHIKCMQWAKRGQELHSKLGQKREEVRMMLLIAEQSISHGDKINKDKKVEDEMNEAYEQGMEVAREALAMANDMPHAKPEKTKALYCMGQIQSMTNQLTEAMVSVDEALNLCDALEEEREDRDGFMANLLFLQGQILLLDEKRERAKEPTAQALELYRKLNDEVGESNALVLLKACGMKVEQAAATAGAEAKGEDATYKGPTIEQLSESLTDMAKEMIGLDDLAADIPLMDAGLDSLSMVEFRNRLGKEFAGINLPASFLFDQPTVSALSNFMHEACREAAGF